MIIQSVSIHTMSNTFNSIDYMYSSYPNIDFTIYEMLPWIVCEYIFTGIYSCCIQKI